MGMPLGIKYDYKELAENFSNRVVKSPFNSELYYRFNMSQLRYYIAIETDNNIVNHDEDLNKIVTGVLYHLKKMGFRKSGYPREYKCLK